MSFITKAKSYFTDSLSELRKVTWPTRRQMVEISAIVIVITLIVTAYLAGLDWIFTVAYEKLLNFLR